MSINILAFDTSTDLCSASLYFKKKIYVKYKFIPKNHMKYILKIINSLLLDARTDFSKIHVIAYSSGPGNFTGIRISLGIAQGISFARNIPLISIPTLEILAQGSWRIEKSYKVLSAIDAKSNKIYFAKYIRLTNGNWILFKKKLYVISLKNFIKIKIKKKWSIAGTAWNIYKKYFIKNEFIFKQNIIFPSAIDMIQIARNYWKQKKILSPFETELNYLNG